MTRADAGSTLRVRVLDAAPGLLDRCPDAGIGGLPLWTDLAARHYDGAEQLWLLAELGTEPVGAMAVLARRRHGMVRLESSFDGMMGGPRIPRDLPAELQDRVFAALADGLAGHLGGRRTVAAVTVADADSRRRALALAGTRWRADTYSTAVVDCREGLGHVERNLWTNNRRNERNRGLKRGCTLAVETGPAALAEWYACYRATAGAWAQAPVPLGFLTDLATRAAERVALTTVRLEGELVAGHLCLVSGDRLLAYLGAARPDLLRSHFLTTLVYWQDLVHACERGLSAVDFGGCVGRDSLWDFKRRCGAQPEPRVQLLAMSALGRAAARVRRLRGG